MTLGVTALALVVDAINDHFARGEVEKGRDLLRKERRKGDRAYREFLRENWHRMNPRTRREAESYL